MEKKEWGIGRQTEEMEELYEEDGINGRKKRKVKEGSLTFFLFFFPNLFQRNKIRNTGRMGKTEPQRKEKQMKSKTSRLNYGRVKISGNRKKLKTGRKI